MKKLVSVLIIIGIFMSGIIVVMNASKYDIYKELPQAKYDEVLESDTPTIYYYYQDTCHFCASIKPQITEFTDIVKETENLDFKLVDMKDSGNSNAWYDWDAHNKKYGEGTDPSVNPDFTDDPSKMLTADDIKITGTPTMIYVEDGEVINYEVGKDVFKLLEEVKNKYNIDYTFDPSQYGKS